MLDFFESGENKEIVLLNKEIKKTNDKVILQNKVINEIINKLNNVIKDNHQTEDFKVTIDSFKKIIKSQSNEIKEQNFFYQKTNDKVILQNKVINKVINKLNNVIKDNHQTEDFKVVIDSLKKIIVSQSNEIKKLQNNLIVNEENTKKLVDNLMSKIEKFMVNNKQINELQNKLIVKEESTRNLIDSFASKINTLEEKISKQKVVKTKIPINISTDKKSLKKDDGVIVKRESFDDF